MANLSASDLAGRRIREIRKRRGWTAQDLAGHCAKAGVGHITATVITNLETRRRATREISVDELLAIAAVLDVPPLLLMSPISDGEALEVTPGTVKEPLEAGAWIADEYAMLGAVRAAASARPEETERALRWRTDPLTVLRQIGAAAGRINLYARDLANERWRERYGFAISRHEEGIRVIGVRLLHLLDSLAALGYDPPRLEGTMEILARYGIPATLREWQETEVEAGDVAR